jgi:hypothetical protein
MENLYYLNKYDYKDDVNICICFDNLFNVQHEMKIYAYNYIIERQGDNLNKEYQNFEYEYNEKPNRRRQQLCGPFYIKKSKNDTNKITIKEYKKNYGYFYNGYEDINHIKLTISKANNKVMEKYWAEKFMNHNNYKKVIDKINEIYKESQHNKMHDAIYEDKINE